MRIRRLAMLEKFALLLLSFFDLRKTWSFGMFVLNILKIQEPVDYDTHDNKSMRSILTGSSRFERGLANQRIVATVHTCMINCPYPGGFLPPVRPGPGAWFCWCFSTSQWFFTYFHAYICWPVGRTLYDTFKHKKGIAAKRGI